MGNCLIGLIYLICIGKIEKIVCISTVSKWWPVHYIGITHKGHAIHFGHILDHKYNTYAPFWFIGKYQGVTRSKLQDELHKSGRYIVDEINRVKLFALLGSIVVALFVLPVGVYMAIYPFYSLSRSVVRLLCKSLF